MGLGWEMGDKIPFAPDEPVSKTTKPDEDATSTGEIKPKLSEEDALARLIALCGKGHDD